MLHNCRPVFLSACWRPHSEQLKSWIAVSSEKNEGLSLARNYLHDLQLQEALSTFDDGIELIDVLQKVKYPRRSHVVSFLSKHMENSSKDLTVADIRQLVMNSKLSGGSLDYYEAVLNTPSFLAAFSGCMPALSNSDLTQMVFSFCKSGDHKDAKVKHFSAHVQHLISEELARRLRCSSEAFNFLTFLADEGVLLEDKEWGKLRKEAFAQTAELSGARLRSLLQSIVEHTAPGVNPAWGQVIQDALSGDEKIKDSAICKIICNLVHTGCLVEDKLLSRALRNPKGVSGDDLLPILLAWRESQLSTGRCEVLNPSASARLQQLIEDKTSSGSFSHDLHGHLVWVFCLSFFSAERSRGALRALCDGEFAAAAPALAAKDAALLCKALIGSDSVSPTILPLILAHVDEEVLDQSEAIAMLHVVQKSGRTAPQRLLRVAAGRAGGRLVTSRSHDGKLDLSLSLNDFCLLLAGLCFVDNYEQRATLERLLRSPLLTPRVALRALQYTSDATTASCSFTRGRLVKRLIGSASALRAEEVAFVISVLAKLQIRDVAVLEHLMKELATKSPSASDIVVAGEAARVLKLSYVFEQLSILEALHTVRGITAKDLLIILRCCRPERRRALLLSKAVAAIIIGVPIDDVTAAELLLLFVVVPAGDTKKREAIALAMKASDPIARHGVAVDDVLAAFECATSRNEIESLCKICFSTTPDFEESHLMRLLRCAQGYSSVPNSFFRFAGRAIVLLLSKDKMSPTSALSWAELYADNNVQDSSVASRLVAHAASRQSNGSSLSRKALEKVARFYNIKLRGVDVRQNERRKRKTRISKEFL